MTKGNHRRYQHSSKQHIRTEFSNYGVVIGDSSGREKIIVIDYRKGYHYTLIINAVRNEVDLHKTDDRRGQLSARETIFKIPFFTFKRFAVLHLEKMPSLLCKYLFHKVISIDELAAKKVLLIPINDPQSVTNVIDQRGEKRFKLKKNINLRHLTQTIQYSNSISTSFDSYLILRTRNKKLVPQGIAITSTQPNSFFIITRKDILKFNSVIKQTLLEAIGVSSFLSKEKVLQFLIRSM
ncbi:MAG: hypothetical protein JSS82_10840 [Bacteroidetes bacterium]|nr:hypothetical protein [Bacteroidota bacterium]